MALRRALVTGASGFIGGFLVPFLQEKGFQVWANSHRRRRRFQRPVRWVQADLCRFDEVLNLLEASRPDLIFHLAAVSSPRESDKDSGRTFLLNGGGTINLLEAALRFAPKARVLLVSSAHVYGRTFLEKPRVRERDLANPTTLYGASKLLMEMAGLDYFSRHGLRVMIARGFNQLGAGQSEDFVFSNLCRQVAQAEKGKKPGVVEAGNLSLIRDFIHAEDAARAYLLLATRGRPGEIYNVGHGRGTLLWEAVRFLRKKSPARFRVKTVPALMRKDEVRQVVADTSKIRKLGWRPRRTVREGVEEMLDEWRAKAARF